MRKMDDCGVNSTESVDYHKMINDACKKHNIPEHLSQFEKERRIFAEIFRDFSIPETLEKKEKSEKYSFLEKIIRPSLFRYRKINDKTTEALKSGYISALRYSPRLPPKAGNVKLAPSR